MINTVIKRDGRERDFNPKNIRSALDKAFVSVDGVVNDDAEVIISRIVNQISDLNKAKISVQSPSYDSLMLSMYRSHYVFHRSSASWWLD